jgi:hypothetical protein
LQTLAAIQKRRKEDSLPTFAADAPQQKWVVTLSVCFLRTRPFSLQVQRMSANRPWCRMTQTAHSYWRRWNKRVLTQLSLLTATAQKIVQYSQSAFLPDYDHILSALYQRFRCGKPMLTVEG